MHCPDLFILNTNDIFSIIPARIECLHSDLTCFRNSPTNCRKLRGSAPAIVTQKAMYEDSMTRLNFFGSSCEGCTCLISHIFAFMLLDKPCVCSSGVPDVWEIPTWCFRVPPRPLISFIFPFQNHCTLSW